MFGESRLLDLVLRASADAMKEQLAGDPSLKDVRVDFSEPVSAECNGETGRAVTGTFVTGAGRRFLMWGCSSLRPGIGIGEHLPSIQIFDYLVSDYLETRDTPLFRSIITSSTIHDDAFDLGGNRLSVPPPEQRGEPLVFPPSVIGAPHVIEIRRRGQ